MSATSVIGKGLGSAEGTAGGPKERGFVGGNKVLGPRIVACGSVDLAEDGTAEVVLPSFGDDEDDFQVFATANNVSAAHAVGATLSMDDDGTTLAFKGTDSDTICYMVVKIGLAP